MTLNRFKSAALALVAATIAGANLAGPAFAQDQSARVGEAGGKLVYEAEGHRLTAALPLWFSQGEGAALQDQEVLITGDDNSTRFEIVPKGEDAEDWTYLYGTRILLEPERDLTTYRQAAAFGYAMSCDGATGQILLADEDNGDELSALIFVCGEFIEDAQRPDQGEIMTMAFRRTDAGIAVIYEEFRTPVFNGKDPAQWPVSAQAVVERARALLAGAELVEIE